MKYIKTENGQQAFKSRSPLFSARQRTAFIMFDGHKTVEQVLASGAGLGLTAQDIADMAGHGFLAPASGEVQIEQAQAVQAATQVAVAQSFVNHSAQDRYKEAKPLATKLTASLGLRGFLLNLAVESAGGFEELLALLPRIRAAVGAKACEDLERTLTT